MKFLRKEDFYRLCAEGKEDESEELMVDLVEELLRQGRYADIDGFFNSLDPSRLTLLTSLILLTFTGHEKEKFTERVNFLARCETHFLTEYGETKTEAWLKWRR